MRASLERTGGFAGMRMATSADSTALPDEDAKKLRQMVDQAEFFKLPETMAATKSMADRFQYKLTVEDGGRKHTVVVGEEAIPASLKPLVDFLSKQPRQPNR
jgi:hypothetical protein